MQGEGAQKEKLRRDPKYSLVCSYTLKSGYFWGTNRWKSKGNSCVCRSTVTLVLNEAAHGRRRAGGFSEGLPQSPAWLRIVQVLWGFQGNLDKDRNTLKVNIGESAQLLVDLSSVFN